MKRYLVPAFVLLIPACIVYGTYAWTSRNSANIVCREVPISRDGSYYPSQSCGELHFKILSEGPVTFMPEPLKIAKRQTFEGNSANCSNVQVNTVTGLGGLKGELRIETSSEGAKDFQNEVHQQAVSFTEKVANQGPNRAPLSRTCPERYQPYRDGKSLITTYLMQATPTVTSHPQRGTKSWDAVSALVVENPVSIASKRITYEVDRYDSWVPFLRKVRRTQGTYTFQAQVSIIGPIAFEHVHKSTACTTSN